MRQALTARQGLAQRSPTNMGARAEVADAAARLAAAIGDGPESRRLYTHALEVYRSLEAKGSLTADVKDEPARIEALLRGNK